MRTTYASQWVLAQYQSNFDEMAVALKTHVETQGLIPKGYEIIVRPEVIVQQV